MAAKIYEVNPRKKRHSENGKKLLGDTCSVIDVLDYNVAGYAIIAWSDRGVVAVGCKEGGIVERGSLPEFVRTKLAHRITEG